MNKVRLSSIIFVVMMIISTASVFAEHNVTGTLTPEWSPADELVGYTVELCNEGPDPIDEVRIIKNPNYVDISCSDLTPPGWILNEFPIWFDGDVGGLTEMCFYFTIDPINNIPGGLCEEFEFEATTPAVESCQLIWKFESRDEETSSNGNWESVNVTTGVDSTPPEIIKTLEGTQDGDCPPEPGSDDICYITQDTEIHFWVEDPGDAECSTDGSQVPPSGIDHCTAELILDGNPVIGFEPGGSQNEWPLLFEPDGDGEVHINITFESDSVHQLIFTCVDEAGNEVVDDETFKVDTTPPETEIVYDGPYKEDEFGRIWIDTESSFTFASEDGGPICAIGVNQTFYIDHYFPEEEDWRYCENACEGWVTTQNEEHDNWTRLWTQYFGETLEEGNESCHVIEYFSVDYLKNVEDIKVSCHFVDKSAPQTWKVLEGPTVGDCPPEPGNIDSECFIQGDTDIMLNCEDADPHPSGDETIWWRYRVTEDGINWSDWRQTCAEPEGEWCKEETTQVTFNFPDASLHELEWYCVDAVGKTSDLDVEYFRVDLEPPMIVKEVIGEHQQGNPVCPPASPYNETNESCWIGPNVTINVSVEEYASIHASNDVWCEWGYEWDGEFHGWYSEFIGEAGWFEIVFQEDSEHLLHIRCWDAVGNTVDDIEMFEVDLEAPVTTKTYGEPFVQLEHECDCLSKEGGCEEKVGGGCYSNFITSATPITLEAWDEKIGVFETYYRVQLVEDEYCWYESETCEPCRGEECGEWVLYDGSFVIPEESCHRIEYWSVDHFWNEERTHTQCTFVDNTPPEGIKEVGEPSKFIGEGGDCEDPGDEELPEGSGAEITPEELIAELNPGEWVTEEKIVTLDEVPIANLDVLFLFDLTGSMGEELATAKASSIDIMNDIDAIIDNAAFGVGSFMDYTEFYDFCGYDDLYGSAGSGDYPFNLDQDITQDTTAVSDAITALSLGSGWDGPEAYARALWEAQHYDWRTGSKRVVVIFEDNVPHDCSLGDYACASGSTGTDPGPDAIAGNGDDITWDGVIDDLKDAGISVIVIDSGGTCHDPWMDLATETGGMFASLAGAGDLPEDIVDLIEVSSSTVSVLTIEPKPGYEEWVEWDPDAYFDVEGNDTVNFSINISVPLGADIGEHHFYIKIVGDGSILAVQPIWITVPGEPNMSNDTNTTCDSGIDWFVTQETPVRITCTDQEPHPVDGSTVCYKVGYDETGEGDYDDITDEYCDGELVEGYCCVPGEDGFEFDFDEDSMHSLEFVCEDALGNEGEIDLEFFAVETVAPETTKTYLEPVHYIEVCGPDYYRGGDNETNDTICWNQTYIDTESRVQLDAVDPDPHPSGVMSTFYRYKLVPDDFCYHEEVYCRPVCDPGKSGGDCGGNWTEYSEPFGIPEESCHLIEYWSVDMLGNTERVHWQCTYVDKTPPVTEKWYGQPYFVNESNWTEWINTNTPIYMSAYDPEPHPSGVAETNYRVTLVDDEHCWNSHELCGNAEGSGDWLTFDGDNFTIDEESCHLIEYYSVDNVGKTEEVNKMCVFVDPAPPTPNKQVGQPHSLIHVEDYEWNFYPEVNGRCWNGEEDSIDCWSVTMLTPISMTCDDPEPHPVNHELICFNVEIDGDDATEEYCEYYGGNFDQNGDGYCCLEQELEEFYFNELSEHNLKFYCEDALGNRGPIDDEKFKVEETAFSIWLNKKWNLISTPVKLLDDSMEEVFADIADETISVTTYDATEDKWYIFTPDGDPTNDDLHTMLPGWGYWVLMDDDAELLIGGSLLSPATVPPTKAIKGDAWNLIGYYGAEGLEVYHGPVGAGGEAFCELISLKDTIWDLGFTSLWTYWEPDNPDVWKALGQFDNMDPGAGYWVFSTEDGQYTVSTACEGFAPGP